MRLGSTLLALAIMTGTAQAAAPGLPSDARLEPVRPRLEQIVKKAADDGLPADLIVSKVREGLAKGVDVARIETAAGRLAESLAVARGFVAERRPAAAPEVIRAVAEARLAGVDLVAADAVVRADRSAGDTARAVEVLTDLSLRGYPMGRASDLVKDVLTRDPTAVGRVPSTLETLRNQQALTQAETVDAVARGLRGGGPLASAAARAAEEKGHGRGSAATPGGPGKAGGDGFVPPGQLKKQNAQMGKGPSGTGPGKDMGKGRGKN
jgi:hypothetical protein